TPQPIFVEFNDNHGLSSLVGPQDRNILRMEQQLGVSIALRGNQIAISGPEPAVMYAKSALQYLFSQFLKGRSLEIEDVDAAIRLVSASVTFNEDGGKGEDGEISIPTKRRNVFPRSAHQADYIKMMQTYDLVFGLGPAGTGKTYLAVAYGVSLLLSGQIDRIILSRPAVEAGEKLGFLPGDMREKIDPYLRPLYDALHDMLPVEQVIKRMGNGEIEVAPLAFMRGRTLSNAFVILDEAQNTTPIQMKMFLTRLGMNSRMVITGDLTQVDLPAGVLSGLKDALRALEGVSEIGYLTFGEEDVVRHSLVSKIVRAYDQYTKNRLNLVDY
ncbi:MAG: phosphate starvation protein PhoH, partial [Alphaproteobacteria bacterium]|nr:phosphate starvation protein PhoH [Alphaproteobacteria bacterium]